MNSNNEQILENDKKLLAMTMVATDTQEMHVDTKIIEVCAQKIIDKELTETCEKLEENFETQLTNIMNDMTEIEQELYTVVNSTMMLSSKYVKKEYNMM